MQRINRDTSIAQARNLRSINERKLGLHVHQHKGMEIYICWNIIPATGRYFRKCISRRIKSFEEYDMFLASILRGGGLDGTSECFYGSCQTELRERANPCYYVRGGWTKDISMAPFNEYMIQGRLTCLCTETFCIEIVRHALTDNYNDSFFFHRL